MPGPRLSSLLKLSKPRSRLSAAEPRAVEFRPAEQAPLARRVGPVAEGEGPLSPPPSPLCSLSAHWVGPAARSSGGLWSQMAPRSLREGGREAGRQGGRVDVGAKWRHGP